MLALLMVCLCAWRSGRDECTVLRPAAVKLRGKVSCDVRGGHVCGGPCTVTRDGDLFYCLFYFILCEMDWLVHRHS
jgi:hypothetical protein